MKCVRILVCRCGFAVVSAVLAIIVGCGRSDLPPLGTVSGTVTLNGQPLEGVTVMFQPVQGRPSLGQTDANGAYELRYMAGVKGAVVGKHRVEVFWPEDAGPGKPRIPERYNRQSELSFEVKPGRNKFDIKLTSP
ncbi:MAG: carboxypeptidase-like regulatory domain-containing protein [Thermoguttaceae bacterium]|nr:carboxypeptidase-like regulatory domain-containing protein [Thermoguttaceae bacterium]MDW8080160.1 carboxypeptidase regulatory-like domain-containing protein [Thermoguttaceae bacterium]